MYISYANVSSCCAHIVVFVGGIIVHADTTSSVDGKRDAVRAMFAAWEGRAHRIKSAHIKLSTREDTTAYFLSAAYPDGMAQKMGRMLPQKRLSLNYEEELLWRRDAVKYAFRGPRWNLDIGQVYEHRDTCAVF